MVGGEAEMRGFVDWWIRGLVDSWIRERSEERRRPCVRPYARFTQTFVLLLSVTAVTGNEAGRKGLGGEHGAG